ncbi:MAG: S8 family serine peptidase, partial [Candidatus Kapaibacteriota bacterium]
MKRVLVILISCISFLNLTAKDFSNKLDSYSKKIFREIQSFKGSDILLLPKKFGYPFESKDNKVYVNLLVEVHPGSNLNAGKFQIVSRAGDVLHLKTEITKISEVLDDPAITRAAFGRCYRLHLDSARSISEVDLAHKGSNLPRSYTGKRVLIGIFDSGIDLQHPDFKTENGTRILFLWDMGEEFSPKPPQGYDWGREYTKIEIDDNLDSVYQKDLLGHGTQVAGIAGGNGRARPEFVGFAPEADFIIVNGIRNGSFGSFSDADILAACNYIFSKAEELGKPCVINLSLGSIIGSHDNEDLLGKALSNLVAEKNGRAIVASAGNEGEILIHSGAELKENNRYELLLYPVNLCNYEPALCPDIPGYFLFGADVWTDIDLIDSVYVGIYETNNLTVVDEKGFSSKDIVDKVQIFNSADSLVGLVSISSSSFKNSENFMIFISNEGQTTLPIDSYLWSIVFVAKDNGRFDSWAVLPIGSQEN